MPALQVRDLPQETYDKLADCARKEHRSIAQQTTYILERFLDDWDGQVFHEEGWQRYRERLRSPHELISVSPEVIAENKARRKRVLEEIQQLGPLQLSDNVPDVVDLIREGREERDARVGL